ncbi:MAG: signal peptidase I [Oscillospiraceae bacterium]|nr:signal peptidase I [Oscillospiraceae bacterium]
MDENKTVPYQGLYDWIQSIVMTFLAVICLLTFVGRTIGVEQASMTPTLLHGDRMIVRSIFYTPRQGDIVIFSKQSFRDGAALVKRVIALEGDVVDIDPMAGVIYVNGVALYEPYTNGPTYFMGDIAYPYTVPEGQIFVIGDNRNYSQDSRSSSIGPVDMREVIGQVVAVAFPFDRITLF